MLSLKYLLTCRNFIFLAVLFSFFDNFGMKEEEISKKSENSLDISVRGNRQKIVFIGDVSVGKTTIINRIQGNDFAEKYDATIGIDFCLKTIKHNNNEIKLQMWDTAGQEKYIGLIPSYIRNSSMIILVYDVTSKKSFENIPKWIDFIQSIEKTKMVICGNKIDLNNNRVITDDMAKELKNKYTDMDILHFEVSAKNNSNMNDMFYEVVANLPIFDEYTDKKKLMEELKKENKTDENENGKKNDVNVNKNENENLNKNNNEVENFYKNENEKLNENNNKVENFYKNENEKLNENNNNKNENLNINNNPENKTQYINDSHYENTSCCPLCNSCIDYFKNWFS